MFRPLDLTFKPYPAPMGDGDGVIRPVLGYRPEAPISNEPLTEGRDIADVLSYFRLNTAMSGVQPGEIFHRAILTTKPHMTYATFFNPNEEDTWRGRHLCELSAREQVSAFTLVDLGEVAPGATIKRAALEKAIGGKVLAPAVFFKTGYSKRRPKKPSEAYYNESPTLDVEAAEYLTTLKIRFAGFDVRTIDPRYAQRGDDAIYEILNGAGVVVIEDLANLDEIKPTHSTAFIGFPIQIRWALGGPARVFAVNIKKPTDFVDLSHVLDYHPHTKDDEELPFTLPKSDIALSDIGDYPNPWPGRIEPREQQAQTQRGARLYPFRLVDKSGSEFGRDMYIEYSHGTGTHIEAAYFDPWGRHGVPEEVLKRYIRIPKDRLVGEAVLFDLSEQVGPLQQIDYRHLEKVDPGLKAGDICVMRADIADWSFYGSVPGNTPGLSPDAARWLVQKKIRALVIDFAVEKSDPMPSSPLVKYTPNKIHYFLHKNDVPVVEWCVNLKHIRAQRFIVAVCSLPASHQGGFPAQVFVLEEW